MQTTSDIPLSATETILRASEILLEAAPWTSCVDNRWGGCDLSNGPRYLRLCADDGIFTILRMTRNGIPEAVATLSASTSPEALASVAKILWSDR